MNALYGTNLPSSNCISPYSVCCSSHCPNEDWCARPCIGASILGFYIHASKCSCSAFPEASNRLSFPLLFPNSSPLMAYPGPEPYSAAAHIRHMCRIPGNLHPSCSSPQLACCHPSASPYDKSRCLAAAACAAILSSPSGFTALPLTAAGGAAHAAPGGKCVDGGPLGCASEPLLQGTGTGAREEPRPGWS